MISFKKNQTRFTVLVSLLLLLGEGFFLEISYSQVLPEFIPTVRLYGGAGLDFWQMQSLKELGLTYLDVSDGGGFFWTLIEPRNDDWKWGYTDSTFFYAESLRLKIIPALMLPKQGHWIERQDSNFDDEFKEYCYEIVNRYHNSPAWGGIVIVRGASSDVYYVFDSLGHEVNPPDFFVRVSNAGYDGVKQADSATQVVAFAMGPDQGGPVTWEDWHLRAFALSPKFDMFGIHSYGPYPTEYYPTGRKPAPHAGVQGLIAVRAFLDSTGYSGKPIFQEEAGYIWGKERIRVDGVPVVIDGEPADRHAHIVTETYIVARTLNVNLRGWSYFNYFSKDRAFEGTGDYGLLHPVLGRNSLKKRKTWNALQTLFKTVKFSDYQFESKLSGEVNRSDIPFVYQFAHKDTASAKLWTIFSPWTYDTLKKKIRNPVSRRVSLNISLATRAVLIDMMGRSRIIRANASGFITVNSSRAPVYVKANVGTLSKRASDNEFEFRLDNAYPNPFNALTIINYQLPIDHWTTLKVYNTLGEEVATLVDGLQVAGYWSVEWDASGFPSGIYVYRLTAGSFSDVKKFLLLK